MKAALLTLLGVLSSIFAAERCRATPSTELIEAQEDDKATLQCCTNPPTNLSDYTLTCKRVDGNFTHSNPFIYSCRHGVENPEPQTEHYRNRIHVDHEDLSKGVLTLEIFPVQLNDSGQYKCFIPKLNITCQFNITVSQQKGNDAVVVTTPSVEVQTHPGAGTKKAPNVWIIVAFAVIVVLVAIAIGILWKFRKTRLCEKLRGRKDEEDPCEMENLKNKAAERHEDVHITGAANNARNLQQRMIELPS